MPQDVIEHIHMMARHIKATRDLLFNIGDGININNKDNNDPYTSESDIYNNQDDECSYDYDDNSTLITINNPTLLILILQELFMTWSNKKENLTPGQEK